MVSYAKKLWKDGTLVEMEHAGCSVLVHSLHYGVGAFEGIRAYRRARGETCVFRLREHLERLLESCRLALLKPKVTLEQLLAGCLEVLRENQLTEAYLRPLVIVGEGNMGLWALDNPVETFIVAWSWGAYLGADGLQNGIRCKTSSFARQHQRAGFPRGKLTGHYINSVMAKQEARLAGFDEALLTDVDGHVCEGSGENLFVVKDGRLMTPPLSSAILAGVTRDTVLTLAREHGIQVEERDLLRDDIYLADEIFLTGTAAEVTPVREVDHRPIGDGRVGPVTQSLQNRYFDVVRGADDSHPEWLTSLSDAE